MGGRDNGQRYMECFKQRVHPCPVTCSSERPKRSVNQVPSLLPLTCIRLTWPHSPMYDSHSSASRRRWVAVSSLPSLGGVRQASSTSQAK